MVESIKAGPWWSVPQAIVWIVSRSAAAAGDAEGIKFLSGLSQLELIAKSPPDGDPPITLWYAPDALLQAAIRGELAITGLDCGTGKQGRVRMVDLKGPRWKPYAGGEAIVDNEGSAWAELWVRADECMKRWPGDIVPKDEKGPSSEPASLADRTTDNQKREWMWQYRRNLKDAGKKHGREIILAAAMDRFSVLYKDVRSIWDASQSNIESQ
jgi:hypothetical protein